MARSYSRGTPDQFVSQVQQRIEMLGGSIESSAAINSAVYKDVMHVYTWEEYVNKLIADGEADNEQDVLNYFYGELHPGDVKFIFVPKNDECLYIGVEYKNGQFWLLGDGEYAESDYEEIVDLVSESWRDVYSATQINADIELDINFKIPDPFDKWYIPADEAIAKQHNFPIDSDYYYETLKVVDSYGMEFVGFAVPADDMLEEALGSAGDNLGLVVAVKDSTGVIEMVHTSSTGKIEPIEEDDVLEAIGDNSKYLDKLKAALEEELNGVEDIQFDQHEDAWIVTVTIHDTEIEYSIPFDDLGLNEDYFDEDLEYIINAIRSDEP